MHNPAHIIFELLRHGERYSPFCIVLRRANEIECIAPFYIDTTTFRLRFSTQTLLCVKSRLLRLFGDDFIFGETTDHQHCLDAIFHAISTIRNRFDVIFLDCLATTSSLWTYCQNQSKMKALRLHTFSTIHEPSKVYSLRMFKSYDEWLKSLPRKRRQTFAWQTRRFQKNVKGPVQLWCVKHERDVSPFLNTLDKLFPLTWQAKVYGNRSRNTPDELDYFRRLAQKGVLRAYMLLDGSRAVAFLVGFQFAGTYYYEEIGYDPEYSHLGPGGVLNSLLMEDLYSSDIPSLIDFGFGENVYKEVLANHEVSADQIAIANTHKWISILFAQRLLSCLYKNIKILILNTAIEGWLKTHLKHRTS
jgi:hypothetical protein